MRGLSISIPVAPWLNLLLFVVVIGECFTLELQIDSGVGFFLCCVRILNDSCVILVKYSVLVYYERLLHFIFLLLRMEIME